MASEKYQYSVAVYVPSDGGADQADAVVWIIENSKEHEQGELVGKELSVTLRRTLQSQDIRGANCTVRLNIEKAI